VWNPAFDVTPADLVTGYVTDAGLLSRDELDRLGQATPAPEVMK
jgi:methylthioribose-1-phosphate isomerase